MMGASPNNSPPPIIASKQQQQQQRSSLYANLLNSDSSQSISRAPVLFAQQTPQEAQQQADLAAIKNAALRFQPTKRPLPAQKTKPKHPFPKAAPPTLQHSASAETTAETSGPSIKSTLADWTAAGDDDDEISGLYNNKPAEKRPRGGRKKRKKNQEPAREAVQDWDDVYDPSRPNNYEDYRHSDEKWREIRDWKDRLYAHRMRGKRASSDMSDDSDRPADTNVSSRFAPPSDYTFAPPPPLDSEDEQEHGQPPPPEDVPPPLAPAHIPDDATGEDAYARRMRMSQMAAGPPPPPPPPPSPPPEDLSSTAALQPSGTISKGPVRYQLPDAPADVPSTEAELAQVLRDEEDYEPEHQSENASGTGTPEGEAPRTNRPGQRGFAERLMSKYGWTKGSGLGASGTGIVNPLRVQVEKRKKRSDAEGGGYVGPAGKGKIIGSKTGKSKEGGEAQHTDNADDNGLGGLSEVVVLRGMVDGLDLDFEMGEGNLMQEIGDECTEKYGNVERVFIDRNGTSSSVPVFVKFTSQLSALKAVQALQDRIFNGNPIKAQYFDLDKFEAGIYE